MIKNGGFSYNVYSLLYNSCVTSIADYSGAITGFRKYDSSTKLHLRAIRAFLGVPKNACNVGVLLLPEYRTRIEMIRQYHRMTRMKNYRLTKKILLWDKDLNDRNIGNTWAGEVKSIFNECKL